MARILDWANFPKDSEEAIPLNGTDVAIVLADGITIAVKNLNGFFEAMSYRHRATPTSGRRFRVCSIEPDEQAKTAYHSEQGTKTRMPERFTTAYDTLFVMRGEMLKSIDLDRLQDATIRAVLEQLKAAGARFHVYGWPPPSSRDKTLVRYDEAMPSQ